MTSTKPLFAFFGTPRFSVKVLDALEAHGLLPALVITAPDRKRGRGQKLSPSPVKEWALERGIDVVTPEKLKDEAFVAELANTEWDVFAVAAYNKILPKAVLDIPRRGCLNVHPSLLPKFRGPSPVLSAILADERSTGVSIMQMDEKMDEGPVVASGRIELEEEAWPPQGQMFEDLLATEGGNMLAEVMEPWIRNEVDAVPQDNAQATYTRKFVDEDALIDLARLNLDIAYQREAFLKIRAFDHGPRAYFLTPEGNPSTGLRAKRVIITEAAMEDGALKILKVIPEGKKEMLYEDFIRAQH